VLRNSRFISNWTKTSDTLHEDLSEGKRKVHPRTRREGPEVEWVYGSTLSLTSTPDVVGWSASLPGRFTPGPHQRGAENLAPTVIRSPDHPARSESLYRLSCPGPRRPNCVFYCTQRHFAHLRQECHNSKFGIFELLV
jgi:hypothetical protein